MTAASEIPMTPPTAGGLLEAEAPPTKWPKVLGVISILYAAGGMLCAAGTGISVFFMDALMKMGGMDMSTPLIVKLNGVISGFLVFVLGVIMLVGAVKLLQRKRGGPKVLRVWALLRVVMILVGVLTTVLTAPAQIQFQRAIADAQEQRLREGGRADAIPPTQSDEQIWRHMLMMVGIFSAALAIYPVFLGFYLSRPKITAEVDQWS